MSLGWWLGIEAVGPALVLYSMAVLFSHCTSMAWGIWDCNGIARILRCVLEPLLIGLMPDVVKELCVDLKLVIMTVWIVAIVVGMLMDV